MKEKENNLGQPIFHQIQEWLHAYYVEGLNDMLSPLTPSLINEFKEEEIDFKTKPNNFPIKEPVIYEKLVPMFFSIVDYFYLVDKNPWLINDPMLYYQDNENFASVFHQHYDLSQITAVTYIDPPKKEDGGGIEFFYHDNMKVTLHPLPNYIYYFPSWLLHRPLPQTTSKPRLCINWCYEGSTRPIHKKTGDRW